MRQLVYISSASPGFDPSGVAAILRISRMNNRRDDVTGLLLFDGKRFLQALEGPADRVEATMLRIAADDRHRASVILSDRVIARREFGSWAMESKPLGALNYPNEIEALLADVTDRSLFATFAGFARIDRRAA